MQRKFIYFINPISGTKNKSTLTRAITKATKQAGIEFDILHTTPDGNYSSLPQYVLDNNVTDVIICGGDGTVSTITSHLLTSKVAVGIIPTGSGNGLALAARIPYSTRKALQIIMKGHSDLIDAYMINNKFSCMLAGIGNDAEIAHDFALSKVRGLKTYLKLSARKYFKLKPYSFTITCNGQNTTIDAFFVTISNSNQFGNYVTIAPRASLNDGLLDVVVVKKMHRLFLPFALISQISGTNSLSHLHDQQNRKSIIYFQTRELLLINHDNAPLHIDGEPQSTPDKIEVKILPNAFRLLQPYRP